MVEEASEFLKDLRLAITERITSPLVGTYWISWLIWNFKFVLIVFSGEAIELKLQLIHGEMFWGLWGYVLTYGGPAVMTVLFIFAYPRPAEIVYKYRLKYQQKLNTIKQEEENNELLSIEESRKLRLDIREKERKLAQQLDEMEKQVSDLRSENESLKSKPEEPMVPAQDAGAYTDGSKSGRTTQPDELEYDFVAGIAGLTPLETAAMSAISAVYPDTISQDSILEDVSKLKFEDGVSKSRIKIMHAIESLISKHQFIDSADSGGYIWYSFTKKGRTFALDHDL